MEKKLTRNSFVYFTSRYCWDVRIPLRDQLAILFQQGNLEVTKRFFFFYKTNKQVEQMLLKERKNEEK